MIARICAVLVLVAVLVGLSALAADRSAIDDRNAEVAQRTVVDAGLPTGATPGPRGNR